jgi:hypothetical protein
MILPSQYKLVLHDPVLSVQSMFTVFLPIQHHRLFYIHLWRIDRKTINKHILGIAKDWCHPTKILTHKKRVSNSYLKQCGVQWTKLNIKEIKWRFVLLRRWPHKYLSVLCMWCRVVWRICDVSLEEPAVSTFTSSCALKMEATFPPKMRQIEYTPSHSAG